MQIGTARKLFFPAVMLVMLFIYPVLAVENNPTLQDIIQLYSLAIRGDAGAQRDLRVLAEHGNIVAQNNLGEMYAFGWGVAEDDTEAVKWYRKAAEQGHAISEQKLGSMYAFGQGVPRDYSKAYMWVSLAMEKHNIKAIELNDRLAEVMTPEQVAKGKLLVSEWKKLHPSKP